MYKWLSALLLCAMLLAGCLASSEKPHKLLLQSLQALKRQTVVRVVSRHRSGWDRDPGKCCRWFEDTRTWGDTCYDAVPNLFKKCDREGYRQP